MSLADYLAKNYLNPISASNKKSKKRKRTDLASSSTLLIEEDDISIWQTSRREVEDEHSPTLAGRSSEFRKSKNSNWASVGASVPSNAEQAAADVIIASTAEEAKTRNLADDELPQVVEETSSHIARMESGARAGLQSGEQVSADLMRRKEEERREFELEDANTFRKIDETIYRDASGRIINVAMRRAEERRKIEEEQQKKSAELEASKGDVQRKLSKDREKKLADAKYMAFARYANDAELNKELMQQNRWNDPAANFLTQKGPKKSSLGKPLYQGSIPQNRYGIRPGYRWDGVDRSNGFEKEYFAAQNHRQSNRDLEYAWQIDE